jgi:hypothetical protein
MHDRISSIRYEWICVQLVHIAALREKKTQLFSIEVAILSWEDYANLSFILSSLKAVFWN